jgi:hypothetical protein
VRAMDSEDLWALLAVVLFAAIVVLVAVLVMR